MSTHWQLRCADCGDECADPCINHGEETLREIVTLGQHMLTLTGEAQIDYELKLWGWYVPMHFFRRHRGHQLVLRSEYGRTEALVPIVVPMDEADHLARWLG